MTITQSDIDDGLKMRIEYGGGRTVTVTGPATGERYVFSGTARVQAVDPRDAAALLQDRRFALKGVIAPPARREGD